MAVAGPTTTPCQEALLSNLADHALPLLAVFAPAFHPATISRAQRLLLAALLTSGTPAQLLQLLLRLVLRWFPVRHFRFAGDAGYGSRP